MNLFFEHFVWTATGSVLLVMLVMCLRIAFLRLKFVRANRQHCQAFEHRFSQSTDLATAEMQARGADCDMAEVACAGFDAYAEYRQYPSSAAFYGTLLDLMERPMRLSLRKVLQQQAQGLGTVSTVAVLAPVVGVAGALWGVVILGASPAVLMAGLACIALGMCVGVISVIVYSWWQAKLRSRALELENFVEQFLRVLSQRTTQTRY
jgi:biopolymer transport protein ExbB/TolQ